MENPKTPPVASSKRQKASSRRNVGPLTEEFCDQPNVQRDLGSFGEDRFEVVKTSSWNCPIGVSVFICSTIAASVTALRAPYEYAIAPSVIAVVLGLVVRKELRKG